MRRERLFRWFLTGGLLLMSCFLFGCAKRAKITQIVSLEYRFTRGNGIYSGAELTITEMDGGYTASVKMANEPPVSRVTLPLEAEEVRKIEALFEKYGVGKWNGFNKNAKNVLDGNTFSLSVKMTEDQSIEAHGYMRYPSNYSKVADYLQALMEKLINSEKKP